MIASAAPVAIPPHIKRTVDLAAELWIRLVMTPEDTPEFRLLSAKHRETVEFLRDQVGAD